MQTIAGPGLSMQGQSQAVELWPQERVAEWLSLSGLGHLLPYFAEHRITGDILLELDSSDLDQMRVRAVGDKKRFLRAASELRGPPQPTLQASPPPPPPPPPYPSPPTFHSDLRPCPPQFDPYQSP